MGMTIYRILKNASYFSRFCTKKRRNREKRTNYKKKFKLNDSYINKFKNMGFKCVIRKYNYSLSSFLIYPSIIGDFVVIFSNSKELFKYGYANSATHSFSSYFLGLLCARKFFMKFNIYEKTYILTYLDIGFQKASFGSKIFIFIKGMNQGGIQIPFTLLKKKPFKNNCSLEKLKLFFYENCFILIQSIGQILIKLESHTMSINSKNIYKYFFKIYYNIINYCHIKLADKSHTDKNIWNLQKKNYLEKKISYLSKIQLLVDEIQDSN